MFSTKPIRYNMLETLLSLLYIFVAAFLALSILTFHKNSIVYKIREALAKHGGGGERGPGGGDVMDLHGSLDALRAELLGLFGDALSFLGVRLAVGAILVGTGVVLMHFTGMQAMVCDDVSVVVNPVMASISLPLAWVGSAVILFFLYHMHGFRRRFVASIIIGVAVNLVHYYGFFSGKFYIVPAVQSGTTGFVLDAETACVVVALLSSVARFVFMGMIAATTD